jgi:hypothetical protein
MLLRPLALALAALAAGCAPTGHTPTARIALTPAFVPIGDAYQTDVKLDGSGSDDAIDDPTGAHPLAFAWEVDDPKPMITGGALDAAVVTVRLAAASPTTVKLTVSDSDGDSGLATAHVGVTVAQ